VGAFAPQRPLRLEGEACGSPPMPHRQTEVKIEGDPARLCRNIFVSNVRAEYLVPVRY